MYLTHFGLQEKPFKTGPDSRFLWLGAKQREALATLARSVLEEDGFIVVTGDVGTGKTTFANALLRELEDRAVAAKVTYPDFEGVDFLKLISKAYGQGGGLRSKEDFFDHFASYLRDCFPLGKPVVLIIDDAHRLTSEYLAELFRLSEIRENGVQLLKIVFAGQKRLEDLLSQELDRMPGLRVAFSHKMEKMTQEETAQYIAHRLNIARCEREIFPPGAIEEIFHYSNGIPILINMVCELCLSRTFIKGEDTVRPETVKECVKMLRVPEERAAPVSEPLPEPEDMEPPVESRDEQQILDDVRTTIAAKSMPKPHWARAAYAAAIGFLVISIGFTLFLMPASPPDSAKVEVKKDAAAPSTSSETGRVAAPSDQTRQGTPTSISGRAPVASGEDRNAQGTRTPKRERVSSRRSAEQARQAQAERSRRDSGAPERGVAAGDTGRGTSADSGSTAGREPASPGAQDVESGKVIDWLIKKRSEQK